MANKSKSLMTFLQDWRDIVLVNVNVKRYEKDRPLRTLEDEQDDQD